MTNEKAISIVKNAFSWYEDNARESEEEDWSGQHEALRMAIKALEQQPSEDCISREAVLEHICEAKECYKEECKGRTLKRCPDLQWVFDLPPVTPKRPKGKWIRVVDKAGHWVWECDCKWQQRFATNYCPYCGAYMLGYEDASKKFRTEPSEDCISRQAVIILIDEASEMHPYKVVGDSDTYSNYNQGWSDACDWLYANIEGVPSVIPQIQPNSNEFFNFDAPMVKKSDAVSREAVIKNIKGWFDKIELNPDILIDSIVTLPSVTPSYNSIKTELKPCEDCISRQAVDDAIYDYSRSCDVNYEQIMEFIDKLPSVTPKYTDEEIDKAQAVEQAYVDKMVELAVEESKRPKGKWIEVEVRNVYATLKCSVCGRVIEPIFDFCKYSYEDIKRSYPYCHCGAYMGGGEDGVSD